MTDLGLVYLSNRSAVESYLTGVIPDLSRRGIPPVESSITGSGLIDAVFEALTSRRFGHLGRKRSEPYRPIVTDHLQNDIKLGRPFQFYFDIGPGYHASIQPGELDLSFEVGIAELMLLRQVVLFSELVALLYPRGAHFHLVVDNLCGLATNDIPLESTLGYVESLRSLITNIGATDLVSLLVESEVTSWSDYRTLLASTPRSEIEVEVTATAIDNVSRFLGRSCDAGEAERRMGLYEQTAVVTEILMASSIQGVRLTQRASPSTLGFRPFPGGDQRIQVGQLGITTGNKGKVCPVLISSRNIEQFDLTSIQITDLVPAPITHVIYANRA